MFCFIFSYDTDDEEVDDSECEEDEVNGNENDSESGEEGKRISSTPLLLYTIFGLIFHFGDLFSKHACVVFLLFVLLFKEKSYLEIVIKKN